MNLELGETFHDRPPLEIVKRKFRVAKITAYVAGISFTALFVCIWPGSMLSVGILDLFGFNLWTIISRVWAFTAAAFIIIVPLVQEVRAIWRQYRVNKIEQMHETGKSSNGTSTRRNDEDEAKPLGVN